VQSARSGLLSIRWAKDLISPAACQTIQPISSSGSCIPKVSSRGLPCQRWALPLRTQEESPRFWSRSIDLGSIGLHEAFRWGRGGRTRFLHYGRDLIDHLRPGRKHRKKRPSMISRANKAPADHAGLGSAPLNQEASRSWWARWLFQSVIATTDPSAREFVSNIFAAPVPPKPKSIGTIHELAAKMLSILP
jgi:hypothetical protein